MIGVDVGGTFTDVVAIRNGRIEVTKVPTDVVTPQRAVLEGARRLGVSDMPIFNHASTHGVNAVITRRLPKIGFITTEGHRDMLDAGRCMRPRAGLTDAGWHRGFSDASRPLVPRYLRRGVRERVLSTGKVLVSLDEEQARAHIELLGRCDVVGIAVCTLNAYINDEHEVRLRELVREILGEDIRVSLSSEVSPLAKEYTRASTTIVDTFMHFIYSDYASDLESGLAELGFDGQLNFADCAATLMSREHALEQPYRIVFAGPAAGTVSCQWFGDRTGDRDLICCDVGGTSTDISLVVGGEAFVGSTFELEHDFVINARSTEISSVGAGGGSIVSVSPSGDILVGPESAGADPGPACYGRGGSRPALTDVCLLMGILDSKGFAGGEIQLDAERSWESIVGLDAPVAPEKAISMAYRVAVNNIAEEITRISIRHGLDTRDFSLMAYGAAGPMLLAATLELLRVKRVVVPPHPGLFSALGLLSTDLVYSESRSAYVMLEGDAADKIEEVYAEMEGKLRERIGAEAENAVVRRSFDGRLVGQTWEMPFVEVPTGTITAETVEGMVERFHVEYERRWGLRFDLRVQGATYRVDLVVPADKVTYPEPDTIATAEATPDSTTELRHFAIDGGLLEAGVHQRGNLRRGHRVTGPAVIREPLSTALVCPGQVATIGPIGEIIIEAVDGEEGAA
jgi:N-methylhydantoinase A